MPFCPSECELVKLSREFVYDANVDIATIALQLYTNVALYMLVGLTDMFNTGQISYFFHVM